jgi:hypothetical protein
MRVDSCCEQLRPFIFQRDRRLRSAALTPDVLFSASTGIMIPTYVLLLTAPRTSKMYRVLTSHVMPFILCIGWAVAMLIAAADVASVPAAIQQTAGAFHQSYAAAGKLFMQKWFTVVCWMNLLMLDYLMAREIALDAAARGVFAAHSIILCFMCGPIGFISHQMTKFVAKSHLKADFACAGVLS